MALVFKIPEFVPLLMDKLDLLLKIFVSLRGIKQQLYAKGAFIIYLEGGLWWFWGGVTFFPYYDLGGAVENFNENYIEHKGGPTIFWIC